MPGHSKRTRAAASKAAADSARVTPYKLYGKALLNGYSKSGSSIFVKNGLDEKRALKPRHIVENLSAEHCESSVRGCPSVCPCRQVQSSPRKYAGKDEKFTQFGLPEMKKRVDSSDRTKFLEACHYLNVQNKTIQERSVDKQHLRTSRISGDSSDAEKLADTLRRLVLSPGRMYLASTSLPELLALDSHRDV
eukprot:6475042-Amphidinium_carterae.1